MIYHTKKLSLVIAALLILASVTVLFSAGNVEAHSPSDVSIEYDEDEEELTVDITHSVTDPQSHYIDNVVVEVDGETEIDEDYDEQPDDTNFQYIYDLEVEPGSTIEVNAYCNQGGDGSDTLEVEEEEEDIVVHEFTVNGEDDEVTIGLEQDLDIYAEVENQGEGDGEIALEVNGQVHKGYIYEVEAGEEKEIEETHDHATWEEGEFTASMGEQEVTVIVEEDPAVEEYELTLNIEGNGVVNYGFDPGPIDEDENDDTWEFTLEEGTTVNLEVDEDHEDDFEGWDLPEELEDEFDEEDLEIEFIIEDDVEITANFEEAIPGYTFVAMVLGMIVAIAVYSKKRYN